MEISQATNGLHGLQGPLALLRGNAEADFATWLLLWLALRVRVTNVHCPYTKVTLIIFERHPTK